MENKIEKSTTSSEEESKFTRDESLPQSSGGNEYPRIEKTSLEWKVAQLEANLGTIKERIENERWLKFWVIGTVLAILAGIVGGLTFYHNVTKDSLESYRNLQKDYYQELINLRKESQNSSVVPPAINAQKDN